MLRLPAPSAFEKNIQCVQKFFVFGNGRIWSVIVGAEKNIGNYPDDDRPVYSVKWRTVVSKNVREIVLDRRRSVQAQP